MKDFFVEGGWAMWPVLVFGLVLIVGSVRYAWDGERARLRFIASMVAVLVAAVVHGVLTNVAMVFWYLEDAVRAPDEQFLRILVTGLKESTRPFGLGGALLALALVFVAVGTYREMRRELRAKA